MLIDTAKPLALMFCVVALGALFGEMIQVPAGGPAFAPGLQDALVLLFLAAGISLAGGMLFREGAEGADRALLRTLPVQLFLWAVGVMAVLFIASWYLETHCIFFRDPRRF